MRVDVHVLCELLAGAELASHPALERQRIQRLSVGLHVVYPDERFPPVYAKLVAAQERARQRVPAMDLSIARIPGLEIESY